MEITNYRSQVPNGKNVGNWSLEISSYRRSWSGQSLFEVIVGLGITALILVGAMSLSTASVRNSDFARNDSVATKFAQEGIEYVREQRDTNWPSFYGQATGSPKNLGNLSWPPGGTCNIPSATIFCRTVTLSQVTSATVDVLVIVSWSDGQGTHNVRSATTFTNWR